MHRFIDPADIRKERRLIWASTRSVLETMGHVKKRSGKKSKSRWDLFMKLLTVFAFFLRFTGHYRKGYGNAKAININTLTLRYPNLPEVFNGFTILHLSDLHIDSIPGFANVIIHKIKDLTFDICLLTGDYRRDISGSFNSILKPMKALSKYIQAKYGAFAVLGNHDTYLMARHEPESGIHLLINESVEIEMEGKKLLITGTDDPFYYYSESALIALETRGYDFKVAMVHTPELAKVAAENKYDLYLCGHTHGGQICLKEGFPLVSHQFEGKQYSRGLWHIGKMKGYTSKGVGVSGLPLRFNCEAEVTLIKLMKS
ncbi:MAG: metallophosphoesterase [Bacteroidetes bacterium]|nr:metallophosphoesterase [Bacteroidota bacterium]